MIITIARQCGCMGDEIGQRLADEYGLTFYNKEHIVKLAKENGAKGIKFYGICCSSLAAM